MPPVLECEKMLQIFFVMKKVIKGLLNFRVLLTILFLLFVIGVFTERLPLDRWITSNPFKNNRAYTYTNQFKQRLIVANSDRPVSLEIFYENPEALFQNTERLISDMQLNPKIPTKVALVRIEGRPYIAKKYYQVNFLSWTKFFPIRGSYAYKSWYYADLLNQMEIKVAKPLLLIEKKFGPFWISSYTLQEYIPGIKASQYFGYCTEFDEGWQASLEELKELLSTLNNSHIIHRDLHLDNIMIQDGKLVLIDLDYMRSYYFSYAFKLFSRHKKDIKKLSRDIENRGADRIQPIFKEVFNLNENNQKSL